MVEIKLPMGASLESTLTPAVKMMTAERLILTMIMTSVLLTSMIVTSPLCGRR